MKTAILIMILGLGNPVQIPMDDMKTCKVALWEQRNKDNGQVSRCVDTETGESVLARDMEHHPKFDY